MGNHEGDKPRSPYESSGVADKPQMNTMGILLTHKKVAAEQPMNENKRKKIEAKLIQLFSQSSQNMNDDEKTKLTPTVVKVIRRRKGKPDIQVA